MKSAHKNRKQKDKHENKQPISISDQLTNILKSINIFLKKYFELAENSVQQYQQKVKQFFIKHSTCVQYSCGFSSMFSKLGNMLQPFIHNVSCNPINTVRTKNNNNTKLNQQLNTNHYYSNKSLPKQFNDQISDIQYQYKQQMGQLQARNRKLLEKLKKTKEQLKHHRQVNKRLTNFVYMLRINNIDVDSLYQKGCLQQQKKQKIEQQILEEQKMGPKYQTQNYTTH